MRNYPSMSYCMCENTLHALQQVITAMQEEGSQFLQDLSQSELQAFNALYSACGDFMQLGDELIDAADREAEYDGQPSEYDEWQSYDEDC